MRTHMKQAKDTLDKLAVKIGERVEQNEIKDVLEKGIANEMRKKPDPSNPMLQKTNLNNMYQGKLQATMMPNKQD
jgi:hypothetical protein